MYTNLEYVCTKYPFKKVHCCEGICATYFVEYWYKCRKSCMMSDLRPGPSLNRWRERVFYLVQIDAFMSARTDHQAAAVAWCLNGGEPVDTGHWTDGWTLVPQKVASELDPKVRNHGERPY